jgi:hypothetical protein
MESATLIMYFEMPRDEEVEIPQSFSLSAAIKRIERYNCDAQFSFSSWSIRGQTALSQLANFGNGLSASKLLLMPMFKNPLSAAEQSARRNFRSLGVRTSCRAQLPAAAVTPANNSAFRNFYNNCIYMSAAVSLAIGDGGGKLLPWARVRQKKFEKSHRQCSNLLPRYAVQQWKTIMESRLTMRDLRDVTRSYLHTMRPLHVCT